MNAQILEKFQERIGYCFENKDLLLTALTHSSYARSAGIQSEQLKDNERLEFLGDAVLGLCVGEQVFKAYSGVSEGVLSRTRATAVCEDTLYKAAKKLGIPDIIQLSYGEIMSGGKDKPSILSDALEAVIGAIYLDGGLEAAKTFVMSFTDIKSAYSDSRQKDSKTRLQEYVQERHMGTLAYDVVNVSGPDHMRVFTIELKINDKVFGVGKGHSKHEAGKNAAAIALKQLERKDKE